MTFPRVGPSGFARAATPSSPRARPPSASPPGGGPWGPGSRQVRWLLTQPSTPPPGRPSRSSPPWTARGSRTPSPVPTPPSAPGARSRPPSVPRCSARWPTPTPSAQDELAKLIALEMGKPVRQAVGEVQLSGAIYQWYADHGPGLLEDEKLDVPGADETVVRKLPVGSLIGVMPWNFPYYQVARFAAPNLMLGNTILLKHAPSCPQSALLMEEIFNAAGLVEGRLRQHLRHQRPDRRHDRRPAGPGRLADRQRARGCRRRGGRRPQPEEGRARARRLRRLHRAGLRRTWTRP